MAQLVHSRRLPCAPPGSCRWLGTVAVAAHQPSLLLARGQIVKFAYFAHNFRTFFFSPGQGRSIFQLPPCCL